MAGFDQWLSGSVGSSVLPVWAAGALAALLVVIVVWAFTRAAQPGKASVAWRIGLIVACVGLAMLLVDGLGGRDGTSGRRPLLARLFDLNLRAIDAGSPLACLDAVGNDTVETACEKALFASPQAVAAAVAYVDARLSLLGDAVEVAARDRAFEPSLERLRRSLEADRFGIVAHVLSRQGCTPDDCPPLKLLRDPRQVTANLRERVFDASVILHSAAWNAPAAPASTPPTAPVASSSLPPAPPQLATTGTAPPVPPGKYDFPSAASIPAISIMSAEPALPPGEAVQPPAPQSTGSGTARTPAPQSTGSGSTRAPARRAPPREPREPPSQQASQAPPQPAPLPPPGTIANPR
jgi:hypothetical protein